jgi:chemotaxis methyl-accepting protein methylase
MAGKMIDSLASAAEKRFGIKTDPGDIKKIQEYLLQTHGSTDPEIIEKVFSSGEAAGFLTVSETYFFREGVHFNLLHDLLPSYEKTGLRLCCAAVASGCEAYSIAMLIESYNRSAVCPINYHIDAFDLNPKVIEAASRGVYSERTLREDGSSFRYMAAPYLEKDEDQYRIREDLKKNIDFFVHNLMDTLPPKEYDIVFFRNAFIYFLPQYRERVLSNLSAVTKEGGYLIMGVAETAGVDHADFREINNLGGKDNYEVFYF